MENSDKQASPAAQSGAVDIPRDELPGMWDTSDFTGGETDSQSSQVMDELRRALADVRIKHEVACSTLEIVKEQRTTAQRALAAQCEETKRLRAALSRAQTAPAVDLASVSDELSRVYQQSDAFEEYWKAKQECPEHNLITKNAAHATWHEACDWMRTLLSRPSVPAPVSERLAQLEEWINATGAIVKNSSWHGELQAIVAGKGDPVAPVSEQPAFPERDPSKPAEQQGMFRKFDVRRVDGSDQPGGKHHECRYFVLDLDHDKAAPAAMRAYAAEIRATHQKLADDIEAEFGEQPAPCGGKIGYYSARSSGFSERRCEKCGWRPPRELLDVKNCPRIPSNNQPAAQTAGVLEALRQEQARRVMPLIGPLLDAYEGTQRSDLKDLSPGIARYLGAINRAMIAAPQPVAEQAAEAKPVAKVRVTHKGYGMELSEYVAYALPEGLHDLYATHSQAAQAKGGDK